VERAVVDLITIGILVLIFVFIWWVARSMRAHLGGRETGPVRGRRLEVRAESGTAGVSASLDTVVIIGRSKEADLMIDDPFASDFHARVAPDGEGFRIQDLGSTNGTFLNDERLSSPAAVAPGDTIRIGRTIMGIR
jgi:hypothetical protein